MSKQVIIFALMSLIALSNACTHSAERSKLADQQADQQIDHRNWCRLKVDRPKAARLGDKVQFKLIKTDRIVINDSNGCDGRGLRFFIVKEDQTFWTIDPVFESASEMIGPDKVKIYKFEIPKVWVKDAGYKLTARAPPIHPSSRKAHGHEVEIWLVHPDSTFKLTPGLSVGGIDIEGDLTFDEGPPVSTPLKYKKLAETISAKTGEKWERGRVTFEVVEDGPEVTVHSFQPGKPEYKGACKRVSRKRGDRKPINRFLCSIEFDYKYRNAASKVTFSAMVRDQAGLGQYISYLSE